MKLEPVPLLPFELHNIQDFVNQEHPTLHPKTAEYHSYWVDQIDHCINGKWGLDQDSLTKEGGWRWMPGNLYFYINMTVINREGDYGTEIVAPPMLRDIEWLIFYALTECEGFAGFSEDEEFSCYRPLGKKQKGEELSHKDVMFLEQHDELLRKPNGEYKEYRDARDVLYDTYGKPLGKPLFLNECQDLMIMSSRRIGKSWSIGGGNLAHEFVFGGARTVDDFLYRESKSTMVVGSGKKDKSNEFLDKFEQAYEHLRTNVGAYNVEGKSINGLLWHPTEGSLSSDSKRPFSNRVTLEGGTGKTGPGSKIVHVTYHTDASAGVGYGARKMVVEEVGQVPNFKDVHGENDATMTRDTRYGFCTYIGTGGQVEKTQEVQDAFESPRAYNILPFKDKFSGVDREIGLFIPGYYVKNVYKTEQGNTKYKEAFEDEIKLREKKKKESEISYERRCISFPIVPQEMFLSNANNPFPIGAVDDRLTELTSGGWERIARIGEIEYTDRAKIQARFKEDKEGRLKPIYKWRQERNKDNQKDEYPGAFVIYEKPAPYRPKYTSGYPLYIAAYDSVMNEDGGSSLCVVTVFKTVDFGKGDDDTQFNIVAEWVGRYNSQDKNHEQAFKLAALYNCKILVEDNLRDVRRLARVTGRYDMLEPRPHNALGNVITSYKGGNPNDIGIRVSTNYIPAMERSLNDLLESNTLEKERIEYLGDEDIEERVVRMVDRCPSVRFLEELKYYDRDGNYDYVSTMFLIGIWVKQLEFLEVSPEREKKESNKTQEILNHMKKVNRGSSKLIRY